MSPARRDAVAPVAPVPMLATLGRPPAGAGWAVEWKFDGQRALIAANATGAVAVFSRNGMDVTHCFPDVAAAVAKALDGRAAVLDGEIVVLDSDGRPHFGRLQQRWPQQRRPTAELLRAAPARFYAFDVLAVAGVDVTGRAYSDRREVLSSLAAGSGLRVVPSYDTAHLPAVEALAVATEHGMEGIVTKRLDSPYRPGQRSPDWIKTCARMRSEFLIGGWVPGTGANRATIGALLVGAYDDDQRLIYCGTVGSGLSSAHRRLLLRHLAPLVADASPFHNHVPTYMAHHARWVRAETAGDVEYRELRGLLRHPSWKGLRADLDDLQSIRIPADDATTAIA